MRTLSVPGGWWHAAEGRPGQLWWEGADGTVRVVALPDPLRTAPVGWMELVTLRGECFALVVPEAWSEVPPSLLHLTAGPDAKAASVVSLPEAPSFMAIAHGDRLVFHCKMTWVWRAGALSEEWAASAADAEAVRPSVRDLPPSLPGDAKLAERLFPTPHANRYVQMQADIVANDRDPGFHSLAVRGGHLVGLGLGEWGGHLWFVGDDGAVRALGLPAPHAWPWHAVRWLVAFEGEVLAIAHTRHGVSNPGAFARIALSPSPHVREVVELPASVRGIATLRGGRLVLFCEDRAHVFYDGALRAVWPARCAL